MHPIAVTYVPDSSGVNTASLIVPVIVILLPFLYYIPPIYSDMFPCALKLRYTVTHSSMGTLPMYISL